MADTTQPSPAASIEGQVAATGVKAITDYLNSQANMNSQAEQNLQQALHNAAGAYGTQMIQADMGYGNMLQNAAQNLTPEASYLQQVWGGGAPLYDPQKGGTMDPSTGQFTSFAQGQNQSNGATTQSPMNMTHAAPKTTAMTPGLRTGGVPPGYTPQWNFRQ